MREPEPIMRHPTWWYRVSLGILVLGVGYLLVSGRLIAAHRIWTAPGNAPESAYPDAFLVNLLWMACIVPFGATVHWLVTQRRAERRLPAYLDAAKTILVVAWRGAPTYPEAPPEEVEAPPDEPWLALLKGASVAVLVPGFFWFGPAPIGHTTPVALWLGAVGVGMGGSFYCIERARPHVKQSWLEQQRSRFWSRNYTVNPANYEPAGRRWIIAYWVLTALFMVTWLSGAFWAMGQGRPGRAFP